MNRRSRPSVGPTSPQDQLVLLKLVPGSPCAFVLYCRSCLQFQQYKAAHIFSGKGIVIARALEDDAHLAQARP